MADTIAAVATGRAVSAIGVLRLSGENAVAVASKVFAADSGLSLAEAPDRKLILGSLRDARGRTLDQVQAVVSRAPRSYTGEDTVELQCHGSPAALAAGLEALFAAGARQAGPGEFTKRAFLNGRMDLIQAEAVIDLIEAESAEAAANAAGQLTGAISRRLAPVYDELAGVCAHFHAALDYPDEDIQPFQLRQYRGLLERSLDTLADLRRSYDRGRVLKEGVKAAILGKPNVGKSSLLNALAGYERVIVADQAGTTRDAVTEPVHLGGVTLRLTDTAGLRETGDGIEARGVELAERAAGESDLLLCVFDGSEPLDEGDDRVIDAGLDAGNVIAVLNKSDLPSVVLPSDLPFEYVVPLSAKTGAGLELLEQAVSTIFPDELPSDGGLLTNARHAAALDRAGMALSRALDAIGVVTPDAALTDVEEGLDALGELTGKVMRQEITDQIFARFCVGK